MRKLLQFISIYFLFLLAPCLGMAQTVKFNLSGGSPPIVVSANSSINVTFFVDLTKPESSSVEGSVKIYVKADNGGAEIKLYDSPSIAAANWTSGSYYSISGNFNVSATQLGNATGVVFARLETSTSLTYSSENIQAVVSFPVTNNTISASGQVSFVNSGNPSPISGSVASGGNGAVTYQWQSSVTSTTSGFSNITGATTPNFDPPIITKTTYYRRVANSKYTNSTAMC